MGMMSVCNSGGADGADATFGLYAKQIKHQVNHFAFRGMKSKCEDIVLLDPINLRIADPYLLQANKTLKRQFPCRSEYVNNLLRRNYWQVRDTNAVFAAAPLNNNMVEGGTAWAVQMALDMHVPILYIFDLTTNKWHQWLYSMGKWEYLLPNEVFKPDNFSVYTGIGSRELTFEGYDAIKWLYGQ